MKRHSFRKLSCLFGIDNLLQLPQQFDIVFSIGDVAFFKTFTFTEKETPLTFYEVCVIA